MSDLRVGSKVYDRNGKIVEGSTKIGHSGGTAYVENGVVMCNEIGSNSENKVKIYYEDGHKIYEQFGRKKYEQDGIIYKEFNYVAVYRCIEEITCFLREKSGIKSITFKVGEEYCATTNSRFMFFLEHPYKCLGMFTREKMNRYFESTGKQYNKKYMIDLQTNPSYK